MRAVAPLLLLLPLLEIATFVIIGREIGVMATVALVILSMVAGCMLLRRQGLGVLRRARIETDAGRDPSRQLAHGVMIVLAAILLIVPGFLTDIAGLLLFVPRIRDLVWRQVKSRFAVINVFDVRDFGGRGASHRGGPTIDLDEADFVRRDRKPGDRETGSPWRRLPDA